MDSAVLKVNDEASHTARMTFGDRLKALRENAGLFTMFAAEGTGITVVSYGAYEGGRTRPPKRVMEKLAAFWDVSVMWLETGLDPTIPDPLAREPWNVRLKRLRIAKGLEQKQVARTLGIPQSGTYSTYELGKKIPRKQPPKAFAKALGVSVDYLRLGHEPGEHVADDIPVIEHFEGAPLGAKESLGSRIKRLREGLGFSPDRIAQSTARPFGVVQHWEENRSRPGEKTLELLAKIFSVSVDYLLNGEKGELVEMVADEAAAPKVEVPGTFGKRLAKARMEKGWSQTEFAERVTTNGKAIHANTVWHWESDRAIPVESKLIKVAHVLGVSPDYLEFGTVAEAVAEVEAQQPPPEGATTSPVAATSAPAAIERRTSPSGGKPVYYGLQPRLKAERLKAGLNMSDASKRIGLAHSSWEKYEKGKTGVAEKHLSAIAKLFGITVNQLIGPTFEGVAPAADGPAHLPVPDGEPVNRRLARLRAERGWGQRDLGAMVGKSSAMIGHYETGRLDVMKISKPIADAFGITVAEFAEGTSAVVHPDRPQEAVEATDALPAPVAAPEPQHAPVAFQAPAVATGRPHFTELIAELDVLDRQAVELLADLVLMLADGVPSARAAVAVLQAVRERQKEVGRLLGCE